MFEQRIGWGQEKGELKAHPFLFEDSFQASRGFGRIIEWSWESLGAVFKATPWWFDGRRRHLGGFSL